jgi:hypothetical protein
VIFDFSFEDLNPASINTALITVVMAALGLVSFVLRAVLVDIQAQLRDLVTSTAEGRVDAVRDLGNVVRDSAKDTDLRLDRLIRATELSARTELLRLIGSPDIRPEVKDQARAIVEEIANGKR